MKVIVLVALLVACAAASKEQWQNFKLGNRKSYRNAVEERLRYQIFQDNLKSIEEHNAKFKKGEVSFKKAVNRFADMSGAEFLAFLKLSGAGKKVKSGVVHQSKQEAPKEINWVEAGATTGVKDQGSCGSCWSFSATGSLEGQLQIRNGTLVSLSEQHLVDCSGSYGNEGCNGGLMEAAFGYIHVDGIMSEADYPYEGRDGKCRANADAIVTKVSGFVEIQEDSESDLLNAVGTVGPVSVAIEATMELQFYDSGLFDDGSCSKYGLNHGVLAAGYGSTDGTDYWLVKNSWGAGWGEKGYVRFIRGKNLCGIATDASYPTL